MDKTKFQKQQKLAAQLNNYWGIRAVAQLKYLEEMLRCGLYSDESLSAKATDWLYGRYMENGAIGKEDVRQFEEMLAPAQAAAKSIRVNCIGHAHIDMNWMWAFDETVMVAIETVRTMLQLMKEYPDFVFMQSQASVYKIVEEFAPELLPEIRERIRGGQWEVTASTWVETDKNMPNGESLTRHLLYTRQYLMKLLGLSESDFRIDFEPDTFGHTAQVPEILASGGVKYYYHCRGYDGHSLYRWKGLAGSQVTVFRESTWYNDTITPDTFLYVPEYGASNGLHTVCHVFGVGDHGGGATRRDIERIHDMAGWPCMPDLGFGKLIQFFEYMDGLDLPTVQGELNFVFDGCYTTETRIKKANRTAEAALNTAEALNTFSALCGAYRYSPEAFASAWENILFNQFHDIIPGSGVIGTREYAMGMYQRTFAYAGARTNAAARGLSDTINTAALLPESAILSDSVAEGAGVGFGVPSCRYTCSAGVIGGEKRLFHAFNPTQAAWDGLVELTVWDWPFEPSRAVVCDESGTELPIHIVDHTMQPYWAHNFFRILVQCPVPAFGYRTLLLKENDCPVPKFVYADPRVDTPLDELVLENAHIRAEFDTESLMLISCVDKATGKDMLRSGEQGGFYLVEEDDSSGMTAWRVGRHAACQPAVQQIKLKARSNGPLRSSFSFEGVIRSSRIQVSVWLDSGSRVIHYAVHCAWREIGAPGTMIPQLAFRLPYAQADGDVRTDAAFAVLERGPKKYDIPADSYAYLPADQSGLMLLTDSKYGYRYTKDALAVTLIRSSYDPDNLPEVYDHDFVIGVGIPADGETGTLLKESLNFTRPPLAIPASSHTGSRELSGTMMAIDRNDVLVSSVKMAEDGSGEAIVRLADLSGRGGKVQMQWPESIQEAAYVDAHEQPKGKTRPQTAGQTVSLELPPSGIAAVRLKF